MEVESFESEEVAKLLNDWFVSIKVSLFIKFKALSKEDYFFAGGI